MDISNRNESNLIQTNWNTIRRNGPKGDRIRNFYLLRFWGLNCIDLDTQLIGQRHIYIDIYGGAPFVLHQNIVDNPDGVAKTVGGHGGDMAGTI